MKNPSTSRALSLSLAVLASGLTAAPTVAQTVTGEGCAGASGVTPTVGLAGVVAGGSTFEVRVRASGGVGLGYLLVGFSDTSASALGGLPLPLDLGTLFGDPLWSGCLLRVDPSFAVLPYLFEPATNGEQLRFQFPGFGAGRVLVQDVNIDPDLATRVAGVSGALEVVPTPPGFAAVPAGSFVMGSSAPSGAPYFGSGDERPLRTVTISRPFLMGTHEVTQAQFEAVMGFDPSTFDGPSRPVERVSWFDAMAYCDALTQAAAAAGTLPPGLVYRLPTEAEWEYACRAGSLTEFAVGDALSCSQARIGHSLHGGGSCSPTGTADVGSHAPNAFGLFDMHGNVAEWCLDSYAAYGDGAAVDPFQGAGRERVVRGGSWFLGSDAARSAARSKALPAAQPYAVGFRVVLAPPPAPAGLVEIGPGTFAMGSDAAPGAPHFGSPAEGPVHQVTITRPFWIGATEVTQAEYVELMGENPSTVLGAELPVHGVSWFDARAYCTALTAREAAAGRLPHGYEYRLPTEAEWEYACRAGTTTEFNVGDQLECWQAAIGTLNHTGGSCGTGAPQHVGSYAPNAFGLFDLHGNVWEWCLDAFAPYGPEPVEDPFVGGGDRRVLRGASWASQSFGARSAYRLDQPPAHVSPYAGFRVVLGQVLLPEVEGMVLVQPGTFSMGSHDPLVGGPIEYPAHEVTISRHFWIGVHEVTQAEFESVMGFDPSFHDGADRPVDSVSWYDATEYCARLTLAAQAAGTLPPGYEFRLPTEAEWEYACRAGTSGHFHTGDTITCAQARLRNSFPPQTQCTVTGTVPVGSYEPNPWGLFDVHGNVAEWCYDSAETYTAEPRTDPVGTSEVPRVVRGGGHFTHSVSCRSSARDVEFPTGGNDDNGFRVVLAPVLP